MDTIASLNREAEINENATSTADWWRRRSRVLDGEAAADPKGDWDAEELAKAVETMIGAERLLAEGKVSGQLAIEVSRAYRRYVGITNRRPDLPRDDERWDRLYQIT